VADLDIRPLQAGLGFGLRIRGVTRDLLTDPAQRQRINALFEAQGMIVFEEVEPSNELQLAVSNCFGPLKEHPVAAIARVDRDGMPGVVEIRSHAGNGGVVEIGGRLRSHWLPWHFDHCYNNELNRAGVLRPVIIVEDGGITGFADGVALYNAFPKDLLARIEGKDILYRLDGQYDTMRFGRPADLTVIRPKPEPPGFAETAAAMPRAIHPAVWTLPSGEKCLHVGPYMAQGILGMENPEGDALLEEVCQTVNRLANEHTSYHHTWRPTDMVIWDNWRMLHCVSGNRPEDERLMYRTTIKGDYGLGRFEEGRSGGKILSETTV
jgi:taurine dioxygenase